MVDTSQTPALGYMEVVPDQTAATLLPIVQAHILPGTIIHSDEWAAYQCVASLPNVSGYDAVIQLSLSIQQLAHTLRM